MSRPQRRLAAGAAIVAFTFPTAACSLLLDLNARQCATTQDCKHFGSEYTCSAAGVCEAPGAGGAGGTSSTSSTSSSASSSSTAPPPPQCTTNRDCITANAGQPYICRNQTCQSLTTASRDCPFVFAGPIDGTDPTYYLTAAAFGPPLIFGAYAPLSNLAPQSSPSVLNYRFAIDEFMHATGGVGSPARPYVMVLCQSQEPDINASMNHLVNKLGVQAVMAALAPQDLKNAFGWAQSNGTPVFFLNPFEADTALLTTSSAAKGNFSGLMWHMLGPYTALAPAYAAVVNRVAAKIRQSRGVGAETPLNVALVDVGQEVDFSADLGAVLPTQISVNNGRMLGDPSNGNDAYFVHTATQSSTLFGTPTVDQAITALTTTTFKPDIVISLGTNEFLTKVVPALEQSQSLSSNPPFYVLSPVQGFDTSLTAAGGAYFTKNKINFAYTRMVGVNYATYPDRSLYNAYIGGLQYTFPNVQNLANRENFYDATYFLMYSLAYASAVNGFTANDVAAGMRYLVSTSPLAYQATVGLGTGNMPNTVLYDLTQAPVALTGTMGPPDFNLTTGARNSQGNGWCVQGNGTVVFDTLVYQPQADGGVGTLTADGGVCATGL